MSGNFLQAVIDAMLPAEMAPPPAGAGRIPSGSETGIDLVRYPQSVPVLEALRQANGGEAAFLASSPEQRRAILEAVERAQPAVFQALLAVLLPDYYEDPAVLRAFGWRAAPPQPLGHVVPAGDEATGEALERAKRRSGLWRHVDG